MAPLHHQLCPRGPQPLQRPHPGGGSLDQQALLTLSGGYLDSSTFSLVSIEFAGHQQQGEVDPRHGGGVGAREAA